MFEDVDYRILRCDGEDGDWFDVIAYIWFVALPQYVIVYASFFSAHEAVKYVAAFVPLAYIIEPTFSTKYVGRRIVSAAIWFWALMIIWVALPLWFYAVYLCIPVIWFIKHKREKK